MLGALDRLLLGWLLGVTLGEPEGGSVIMML
jgi:hypothetical protein